MKNLWPLPRRYYYAALAAVLGVVVGLGGPGHVEALISPMKTNHSFKIVHNDGEKVCFEFDVTVRRAGTILFKAWMVQSDDGVRDRRHLNTYKEPNTPHLKVGTRGTVRLCSPLPTIMKDRKIIVYGYIYYEVWHGLWHVPWHICKEH